MQIEQRVRLYLLKPQREIVVVAHQFFRLGISVKYGVNLHAEIQAHLLSSLLLQELVRHVEIELVEVPMPRPRRECRMDYRDGVLPEPIAIIVIEPISGRATEHPS